VALQEVGWLFSMASRSRNWLNLAQVHQVVLQCNAGYTFNKNEGSGPDPFSSFFHALSAVVLTGQKRCSECNDVNLYGSVLANSWNIHIKSGTYEVVFLRRKETWDF